MNATISLSAGQNRLALRKTVAKVMLHTMALSFLTLPLASTQIQPQKAEAATVVRSDINPMHGPLCQPGNCTEHWNGNGKLPPQLLISSLQAGELVTASNLSGNVDWGGNDAGAQNPSSGIDGPNNSIDRNIPKLLCLVQFTDDANRIIRPNVATRGNHGALTLREIASGVAVPAGATKMYGSFGDTRYDDNNGHCFFNLSVQPVQQPQNNQLTCVIEQISIPRTVQPGQQATISFGFRNTGNTTLPAGQTTLVFEPTFNGLSILPGLSTIALTQSVAPGAIATFTRTLTVPTQGGEYAVVAKAQLNGTNISPWVCGTPMTVTAPLVDSAACVTANVTPTVARPGENVHVSITWRNTGTTTWGPNAGSQGYTLARANYTGTPFPGFQGLQFNPSWTVAPGATRVFEFDVTAPAQSGTYQFVTEMKRNGSPITTNVCGGAVTVQEAPPVPRDAGICFGSEGPLNAHTNSSVVIRTTFRNTGTTNWDPAQGYSFIRESSQYTPFPGFQGAALTRIVRPGESITVDLPFTTPSTPNYYVAFLKIAKNGQALSPECGWGVHVATAAPTNTTVTAQKQVSQASHLVAGGQITYNIPLTNAAVSAQGVRITDIIPTGLTFERSSDPRCTINGSSVICGNGSNFNLSPNFNGAITIVFNIPQNFCAGVTSGSRTVFNSIRVEGSNFSTVNASTTAHVHCPQVNNNTQVQLTKFLDQQNSDIRVNGEIKYGITIRNTGNVTTSGMVVSDLIPAGTSFVRASDGRCSFNASTNRVTCPLEIANEGTISVTLRINQCGTLTNMATATGNNMPNAQSNTVTTTVTCPPANTQVQLTKFVEPTNSNIRIDGQIVYGITIRNTGNVPTSGLVVTDQLPAGTSFIRASDDRCTVAQNRVSCPLSISHQGTIYITAKINQCGTLTNMATATGNNMPNAQSNTITTNVECQAQTGCINIQKEAFDAQNNRLSSVPQFAFRLNGNQSTVNDVQGNARFSNVPVGQHTVSENAAQGWENFNITPSNGVVTVAAGNNCANVTFKNRQIVQGNGTITINKTAPSTTTQNGSFAYTIAVTNTSSQNSVQGVSVTDFIPSDLQYISSSSDCAIAGTSVLTCTIGSLSPLQSRTLTINVQVKNTNTCVNRTITNTATAHANGLNSVTSSVSTQVRCDQQNGSLAISKTGPSTVNQNGTLAYNVSVTNSSSVAVNNVVVTDTLPSLLQFVSANGCSNQNNIVTCNVGSLNAGETRQFTINTQLVNFITCTPATITNIAYATATGVSQVQSTQVSTQLQCNTPGQNFTINITDTPDPVRADAPLSYTLQVTNNTNSSQTVDVRQVLPSQVDFNFASENGSHSNGVITWSNQFFSANQTRTYNVTVRTRSSLRDGDTLFTTATAGNAQDTENTRVIDDINQGDDDLDITITDTPDPVRPCEELTYRIRVRNNGDTDRTVTLIAELDRDTEFEDASDNGDERGSDEVEWRNLRIDRDDSEEVELTVKVDCEADDTLNLRARAAEASDTERTDVEEGNIPQQPNNGNLSFTKTASLSTAQPGDTVTYTVTIRNNTNQTVTSVYVNDTFNSNQLQMLSVGTGVQNGSQLTWNIGTLNPGESRILTYTAQISSSLRHGDIVVNNASLTSNLGTLTAYANISIIQQLPQTGNGFTDDIDDGSQFIRRRVAAAGTAGPIAAAASIGFTALGAVGYFGRRFFI